MNFISLIGIVDNYNEKTNMVNIKVEKKNMKKNNMEKNDNWYELITCLIPKKIIMKNKTKIEKGQIIGIKGRIHNGQILTERLQII